MGLNEFSSKENLKLRIKILKVKNLRISWIKDINQEIKKLRIKIPRIKSLRITISELKVFESKIWKLKLRNYEFEN